PARGDAVGAAGHDGHVHARGAGPDRLLGHRREHASGRRVTEQRSHRRLRASSSTRAVRAVVLVGGFGTRLRPLTSTIPKQMLPIVDRPMIERVLAKLAEHGVDDAILSLGYRPDAFIATYPDDECAGVRLHYAVEAEPLDTAGAV